VTDLNNAIFNGGGLTAVVGAVQKAGTVNQTWKGKDFRATVNEEANAALKSTLRNTLPGAVRSNGGVNVIFNRSINRVATTNTTQGQ
jgi:hypothetical protein